MVVTLPSGQALSRPLSVNNAENGETVHIVTTDAQGNFVAGGEWSGFIYSCSFFLDYLMVTIQKHLIKMHC